MTRWKCRWDWNEGRWVFIWLVCPVVEWKTPTPIELGPFDPGKTDK